MLLRLQGRIGRGINYTHTGPLRPYKSIHQTRGDKAVFKGTNDRLDVREGKGNGRKENRKVLLINETNVNRNVIGKIRQGINSSLLLGNVQVER